VRITYVMGGLAREYTGDLSGLVIEWLDASERSGMPVDPRGFGTGGGLRSTYPACMAVEAAAEQGPAAAGRYLRALREGIMCHRRRLDGTEALVEEARRAALDEQRFRVDLGSHAIVEAFGADLERTRALGRELPTAHFSPADPGAPGEEGLCGAGDPYERWRAAAMGAGAVPSGEPPPDVLGALRRFGRMAGAEVEAVCDLPGPRASAELWRLATEWRVRPVPVLTGFLWELA
jgi:hypothetical protein